MLTREVTIDLFEPAQRERIRLAAVQLEAKGLNQRAIAAAFPEQVTQPAVTNALRLDRLMSSLGLESPYVVVEAPPGDSLRLRRHLNPQYQFKLMPGYLPSAI